MTARRKILIALGASALYATCPALAQQQTRIRRVGYYGGSAEAAVSWLAAFRHGMAELRWVEGRDYVLEARYGDTDLKTLPGRIADFAAWQPEVVLINGISYLPAIAKAMPSVPIVLAASPADPVSAGYAANLRRPGGNVTGLLTLGVDLAAKRVELLKEAFPRATHLAVLADTGDSGTAQVKSTEEAARRLQLRITAIRLRAAADIEPGFKRAAALGVNAYIVTTGPLLTPNRRVVGEAIARAKVPAIFGATDAVETGGLISYSASTADGFRRAAAYVDKIFKGAKPGDLPIEQPTKFELWVNMKTAKAIGFTIPQSILLRADRVIE